ncbi:17468_t:CDS:1, partial [Gigaspora rosea]
VKEEPYLEEKRRHLEGNKSKHSSELPLTERDALEDKKLYEVESSTSTMHKE